MTEKTEEIRYFFDGILENASELVAENAWFPDGSNQLTIYSGDIINVCYKIIFFLIKKYI